MFRKLRAIRAVFVLAIVLVWFHSAPAATILPGLIGRDLTDQDDIHDENAYNPPGNLGGFDAIFDASDEPGFGGGEYAFNVFDNEIGVGNAKWCCGDAGSFPFWVQAEFNQPYRLTAFTLTSSNDTPGRDPVIWEMQGSNDGTNYTTIFAQNGTLWTARNQVIRWDDVSDFPVQEKGYKFLRLYVTETSLTSGAMFALNEVELFGYVPEPSTWAMLLGLGVVGLLGYLKRRRK